MLTKVSAGVLNIDDLYGFRNRIINGDMRIDQRNAGAEVTVTTTNLYTLDRWAQTSTASSKFKYQQNAGSVTPPVGFTKYLGLTSLSAYSVGASEVFSVRQFVEGFNVADLGWGTANAKTVTLSFWVRSSLTGTFGAAIRNFPVTESYPIAYTISAADTWEYKTVTIPGATTGTWATDNSSGLQITFSIGAGSTFSGTAGVWATANYASATGATSVVGTNGATFYITGVQLEVGSVATPFERRPYGTELALCQRYFSRITGSNVAFGSGSAGSTTNTQFYVVYPQTMRAAPTISLSSTQATDFQASSTATTINGSFTGLSSAQINVTSSGLTQYRPYLLTGTSASAYIQYSSEL